MSQTTPNYTGPTALISSQSLAHGNCVVSSPLDLTGKFGAYVRFRSGPLGTTAPGSSPLFGWQISDGSTYRQPVTAQLPGNTATPSSSTVNVDSLLAQNVLHIASVSGFAAGDTVIIGAGTAREEYAYVAAVSGSTLILRGNLLFSHTAAQADAVTNKANVFSDVFIPGGRKVEVFADYGAAASGSNIQVVVEDVTYDYLTTA